MFENPFSDEELNRRLAAVRAAMTERGLELLVVAQPENVFYLTGLDHWGYFSPHLLLVPAEGEMALVARQMEHVSIGKQVRNALFVGHADHETAADVTVRLLHDRRRAEARSKAAVKVAAEEIDARTGRRPAIGAELWSSALSFGTGRALMEAIDDADWQDATGLVDALRRVKSPDELALVRRAAQVTDAATEAAIAAIHDGAAERDIAAECLAAMTRAGGAPPGFGPFIRPGGRLGEEHGTWGAGVVRAGEVVFLEISGCVARYHAPNGRLVHVGAIPKADAAMAEVAKGAYAAMLAALRPGARAGEVYAAWQGVVDAAGLAHYRRHHCGYAVGIGFPPSWTGGNTVTGLREGSDLTIRAGMTFHVQSWLTGTGRGDFFLSNTVLVGADAAEVLTTAPVGPTVA